MDHHPRHWTSSEDAQLRASIEVRGEEDWRCVAAEVPGRTHLQCMQRWKKALRPGLVKGPWADAEDESVFACRRVLGHPRYIVLTRFGGPAGPCGVRSPPRPRSNQVGVGLLIGSLAAPPSSAASAGG